jgi:protein gp37
MTVGHQKAADEALPYMRRMRELLGPNAILWVSYEPALEAVNWKGWECINWLVIGGESGSRARSFNPMWGKDAIQWALDNGVAPYFKQLGSNPDADHFYGWSITGKGDRHEEWPDWLNTQCFPDIPPSMEATGFTEK